MVFHQTLSEGASARNLSPPPCMNGSPLLGVLTVNSIRLAQSRESRDACAHGRHSQTDLVGGNRALPITSFAHMGRFRSRDEIHTRMNNTPAAVSVSKV